MQYVTHLALQRFSFQVLPGRDRSEARKRLRSALSVTGSASLGLGCVSRLLELCLELAWVIADASGECRYLCPPRPPKSRALVSCVRALSRSSRLRRSLGGCSGYHVTHRNLLARPTCAPRRHWRLQMPPPRHSSSVAKLEDPTEPPQAGSSKQVSHIFPECLKITYRWASTRLC